MSYSIKDGKDEIHFVTEEDLKYLTEETERVNRVEQDRGSPQTDAEVQEQYPGAVTPDGEVNWDCPCLGGLGSEGPCVEEFRSAFSCWLYSSAEEKGEDCVENFFNMSGCMQENQEFYDDLSARNKAAAEEAQAKYEAEEGEKIAAIEAEQQQLESESVSEPVSQSESVSEAVAVEDSAAENVDPATETSGSQETAAEEEPEPAVVENTSAVQETPESREPVIEPVTEPVTEPVIEPVIETTPESEGLSVESLPNTSKDTAEDGPVVSYKTSDEEDNMSSFGFSNQSSLIVAASVEDEDEQQEPEPPCV